MSILKSFRYAVSESFALVGDTAVGAKKVGVAAGGALVESVELAAGMVHNRAAVALELDTQHVVHEGAKQLKAILAEQQADPDLVGLSERLAAKVGLKL